MILKCVSLGIFLSVFFLLKANGDSLCRLVWFSCSLGGLFVEPNQEFFTGGNVHETENIQYWVMDIRSSRGSFFPLKLQFYAVVMQQQGGAVQEATRSCDPTVNHFNSTSQFL